MATKKTATPIDEKFSNMDFELFPALEALDRKDYSYYDRLTDEQKKKFVPFMMLHWMSAVKSRGEIQSYYLQSLNEYANKYMLDSSLKDHPKLQWLMLCTVSPGLGKQFHQYLPHIKERVALLKEPAKAKDVYDYFKKIYPKTDEATLKEVSEEYARVQKRKYYLSQLFPHTKISDIETLNELITDEEIQQYEKDRGN